MIHSLNRQDYYDGHKLVTLTATIKDGEETISKPFKFFVKRSKMTDNQALEADLAYLKANMAMTVTEDIPFMNENPLPNGSTVTWTSSKEQYVGVTGKVTRPDFGFMDETSDVVGTLVNGTAAGTINIAITVLAMSIEDELTLAAGKITWELIKEDNASQNRVASDLNLVSSIDGINVVWQSSEPSHIAPDGTVTRPQYEELDVRVTLTATLTKDGKSRTITLDGLVVIKEFATPQQACANYVANTEVIESFVTAGWTNANLGFDHIEESFVLPASESISLIELDWGLTNSNGDATPPNQYISIDYDDGSISGRKEYIFNVDNSSMSSDINTYMKVTAMMYDGSTVIGSAEAIYTITIKA